VLASLSQVVTPVRTEAADDLHVLLRHHRLRSISRRADPSPCLKISEAPVAEP
jgi:hypothetical protein